MNIGSLIKYFIIFSLFAGVTQYISAQSGESGDSETLYTRRLAWRETEYVWRYAVEIDKGENGDYSSFYRDFTKSLYVIVSFPAGEYRFRIITYDILDRPSQATEWVHFSVRPPKQEIAEPAEDVNTENENDHIHVIDTDHPENEEQITENERKNSARFNTLGASSGTAFADPLAIITLHGTFAPINNFFIEAGCDAGFISNQEDADKFYSVYPYANLCYFMPFANKGGIFAGAGAGYILGTYHFSHGGIAEFNIFTVNFTAGVNIIDVINFSYTFRTDFTAFNHQIAAGFVYRFKQE